MPVFKRNKNSARIKNKTIVMFSNDKIYSIRINPFFQFFLLLAGIILSSFITYYVTIYVKSQNSIQEKDHKIFIGETINRNLSSHLFFIMEEIEMIANSISPINPSLLEKKKDLKRKSNLNSVPFQEKILTDTELSQAKVQIKNTITHLDSVVDERHKDFIAALNKAGLNDILRQKKLSDYHVYKGSNPEVQNINYLAPDIASDVLSEIKYKVRYYKVLRDVVKSLPISSPMKGTRLTSSYGVRFHPILNVRMFHHGIDFKGPSKALVHSTADGIVKFSGFSPSFGNVIILSHGNDIMTIYAHLTASRVKSGQIVKKSDIIGIQGSTGRSSGEHLHYEVRYKGKSLNPVNFLKLNELIKDNK